MRVHSSYSAEFAVAVAKERSHYPLHATEILNLPGGRKVNLRSSERALRRSL